MATLDCGEKNLREISCIAYIYFDEHFKNYSDSLTPQLRFEFWTCGTHATLLKWIQEIFKSLLGVTFFWLRNAAGKRDKEETMTSLKPVKFGSRMTSKQLPLTSKVMSLIYGLCLCTAQVVFSCV